MAHEHIIPDRVETTLEYYRLNVNLTLIAVNKADLSTAT